MAGDTLPRLARPDGGVGGVGAAHALCLRCLFRVDPRHGRVAVHTSPWLVRATARGEVGAVFTRERAAFCDRVNPSTDVGAVAVLPRHRSGEGSIQSRGGGAQPSAGDWRRMGHRGNGGVIIVQVVWGKAARSSSAERGGGNMGTASCSRCLL